MNDSQLITAAIEASGLLDGRFANEILGVDRKTVERWKAGTRRMPPKKREWLEHWLTLSAGARTRVVRALTR